MKPDSLFSLSKQSGNKYKIQLSGSNLNPAEMFTSHFNSFLLTCQELFSEDTRVSVECNMH